MNNPVCRVKQYRLCSCQVKLRIILISGHYQREFASRSIDFLFLINLIDIPVTGSQI